MVATLPDESARGIDADPGAMQVEDAQLKTLVEGVADSAAGIVATLPDDSTRGADADPGAMQVEDAKPKTLLEAQSTGEATAESHPTVQVEENEIVLEAHDEDAVTDPYLQELTVAEPSVDGNESTEISTQAQPEAQPDAAENSMLATPASNAEISAQDAHDEHRGSLSEDPAVGESQPEALLHKEDPNSGHHPTEVGESKPAVSEETLLHPPQDISTSLEEDPSGHPAEVDSTAQLTQSPAPLSGQSGAAQPVQSAAPLPDDVQDAVATQDAVVMQADRGVPMEAEQVMEGLQASPVDIEHAVDMSTTQQVNEDGKPAALPEDNATVVVAAASDTKAAAKGKAKAKATASPTKATAKASPKGKAAAKAKGVAKSSPKKK
eukprot:gnl/TRDRNA2_/TRDRNA2_141562_c0_seq1.p1 gnl/TRDRNA2_/TRDRNA2_141562_c0~~gnl/TRDRNA2_/TRDRNA2_141562_c0_seq1.p1  ORF type:complete len:405 (+),score=102.66 gnl/TRDRNA2_/TRDRNA2_141562_c0_seq1:77-1216(+)